MEGLDHRGGGVGEQLGGGGGGSGEARGGEAQQRNLDTGILSIIYTFHNYIVCPTLELIVVSRRVTWSALYPWSGGGALYMTRSRGFRHRPTDRGGRMQSQLQS